MQRKPGSDRSQRLSKFSLPKRKTRPGVMQQKSDIEESPTK
jgi:hypothetical protein